MTDQFECPSYTDGDNVLRGCECGKCGAVTRPRLRANLRTILEKVRRGGAAKADYLDSDPSSVMSVDEALKAIEELVR